MISLENSQRRLEVLMQNRLASMNANKASTNNIKDSTKLVIIQKPELKESVDKNTPQSILDNISSTFDEMMTNLHSKFRLPRNELTENPPKLDNIIIEKPQIVNERMPTTDTNVSGENGKKSQLSHTAPPKVLLPPELCSVTRSQNNTVPFLEEEDFTWSESDLLKINNTEKNLSTSTPRSSTQVKSVEFGHNSFETNNLSEPEHHSNESLSKTITFNENKEHFCCTKETQNIDESQNLPARPINCIEEIANSKVKSLELAPLNIKSVDFYQDLLNNPADLKIHSIDAETRDVFKLPEKMSPVTEKSTSQCLSKKSEESDKSNQNIRSKLSEEISTLHKVGGSTHGGGALRGLINREKMMPPGRIASLKPGTLIDLIHEENPQRSIRNKTKIRPHFQQPFTDNDHTTVNSSTEVNQNDTNYILSKLSETDLKKLITENIGVLPTPPLIPFFNNSNTSTNIYSNVYRETQGNQLPTWISNSNRMHQTNLNSQNVTMNNINVTPTTFVNSSNQIQNSLPNAWVAPNQSSDLWTKSGPPQDPRLALKSDVHQKCEKPAYNKQTSIHQFSTNEINTEDPFKSSYSQAMLQTDPFRPSCYDGSNTLDPYRTDPYAVNMPSNLNTNDNPITLSNAALRPSLLGSPPILNHISNAVQQSDLNAPSVTIAMQRPPLLTTPPLTTEIAIQSHSLLNTPPIATQNLIQMTSISGGPLHYDRTVNQNTFLNESHSMCDRDHSNFYPESQHQTSSNKTVRRTFADTAYDSWRGSSNCERNFNHPPVDEVGKGFDRRMSNIRDNKRSYWSSYDHGRFDSTAKGFESSKYYQNDLIIPVAQKDPDLRKLSARDPRRKSIEESNSKKDTLSSKFASHRSEQVVNCRRDPRVREKTPSRDRGRSMEGMNPQERYSRGRAYSSRHERSVFRQTEDLSKRQSRNDARNTQDTYSSPLESLYNSQATPQTGLGYGFQRFKIPKISKVIDNYSSKNNNTKGDHTKITNSPIDTEKDRYVPSIKESDESTKIDHIETFTKDDEVMSAMPNKQTDNEKINENESPSKRRSSRINKKNLIEEEKEPINQEANTKETSIKTEEKNFGNVMEESVESFDSDNQEMYEDKVTDKSVSKNMSSKRKKNENISTSEKQSILNYNATNNKIKEENRKSPTRAGNTNNVQNPNKVDCNLPDSDKIKENHSLTVTSNIEEETKSCNTDHKIDSSDTTCNRKVQNTGALQEDDKALEYSLPSSSKCTPNKLESESKCAIDISVKRSTDSSVSGAECTVMKEDIQGITNNEITTPDKLNIIKNILSQNLNISALKPELNSFKGTVGTQMTETLLMLLLDIVQNKPEASVSDEMKLGSSLGFLSTNKTIIAESEKEGCSNIENKTNSDTIHEKETIAVVTQSSSNISNKKKPNYTKGNKTKKNAKLSSIDCKTNNGGKRETKKAQKRKYKNELDRLQDDISKYHDSEAIAAASGLRLCRLQKQNSVTPASTSNTQVQQSNKKKNYVKKMQKVKDESHDSDTDSCDSDSLFRLSQRLRSKYGSLILEEEKKAAAISEKSSKCVKNNEETDSSVSQTSYPKDDNGEYKQNVVDSILISKTSDNKETKTDNNETSSGNREEYTSINIEQIPLVESTTSQNHNMPTTLPVSNSICNDNSNEITPETINEEKSHSMSSKEISNNIINKYKINKQRKKQCWNLGIIKKKNKLKKVTLSHEETEDFESSFHDDSELLMVPEPPDKNYFLDIKVKNVQCKLCHYKGTGIVTHYAINHPKDEVLISRMSPKAAEDAIKESAVFFNTQQDKRRQITSYDCRICFAKFKKFSMFFEHMAVHTGEFRHECCYCGYRTTTQSGISKHCREKHVTKDLSKASNRVLYIEPKNRMYVCGYLCLICNFFQINQINVKRHIENNHANEENGNHILKINMGKVLLENLRSDLEDTINEKTLDYTVIIPKKTVDDEGGIKGKTLDDEGGIKGKTLDNIKEKTVDYEDLIKLKTVSEVPKDSNQEECNLEKESLHCLNSLGNNIINSLPTKKEQNISSSESKDKSAILSTLQETEVQSNTCNNHTDGLTLNKVAEEQLGSSPKDKASVEQNQTSMECELPVENESIYKVQALEENSISAKKCDLKQREENNIPATGYFEPSPILENHVQSIEAEVNNLYKKKCIEALAAISAKRNYDMNIIETFKRKLSSELNTTANAYSIEELLKNKWKDIRLSSENTESVITISDSNSETTPSRRQLPVRTCKSLVKTKSIMDESDSNEDECSFEYLFSSLDDPVTNDDSQVITEELFSPLSKESFNVPFLYRDILEQCQLAVSEKKTYFPKLQQYKSCLPLESNLSEFNYIMTHIQRYFLKIEDDRTITVGDLKVDQVDKKYLFTCRINCGSPCGFQTEKVDKFGEHLQASHPSSTWDGSCISCYTIFTYNTTRDDKELIHRQTKAFCHLVKDHLKFCRTPEIQLPSEQSTTKKGWFYFYVHIM